MTIPFPSRRSPSADHANTTPPLRVEDYEEPARRRIPDREKPMLTARMVGILKGGRQGIIEYRDGLLERDSVLREVGGCLVVVPFESQGLMPSFSLPERLTFPNEPRAVATERRVGSIRVLAGRRLPLFLPKEPIPEASPEHGRNDRACVLGGFVDPPRQGVCAPPCCPVSKV